MMRRNLFVSIIFVMLFINCNKGNSMEINKNLKAEENKESVSKNRNFKNKFQSDRRYNSIIKFEKFERIMDS